MTQDVQNPFELVSALADGELRGDEFARALALLETSAEARARWHACHVAGDVLRARELAGRASGDADFMARLHQRLQDEVPQRWPLTAAPVPVARPAVAGMAANDALRWKRVAGFASLAALAAITWQLLGDAGHSDAGAQLAQQGGPAVLAAGAPVPAMIRDPRLDQFLAAHQQFGGASALQMPAGFLRNATFEQPAR